MSLILFHRRRVLQKKETNFPLSTSDLLFYYNMEQVDGFSDVHLGNHPMTGLNSLVSGIVDNAALIETGNSMSSSTNLGFSGFPFSFSTWNKKSVSTDKTYLLQYASGNNYAGVTIIINSDGTLEVYYGDGLGAGPNNRKTFTGTLPVNDDLPHHYTFNLIDINTIEAYQDSVPFTVSYSSGTGSSVEFSTDYKTHSDNQMTRDETFGYNRALTQSEVDSIYNNGNGTTL